MKPTHQYSAPYLSGEQIKALEHIAGKNHATPAHLVSLAVDALIAEAARHDGWLPLPEIPDPTPPSPIKARKDSCKP